MWKDDETLSKYEERLDKCKYVSFDIFDTLLLRVVDNPQDMFLKLGKTSIKKGYVLKDLNEFEFKQIRILSQRKARILQGNKCKDKKLDDEIKLKDIYNQMPSNIGNLYEIMKLEIELEKEYTYLNPVTYNLLKNLKDKGKKIFLISDMYLNKEQIKDMLISNGFDYSLIEDLIVSCEVFLNKSTGKLFRYVLDKYNIKSSEMIHIGDNYNSDIQGARKEGIDFIKYSVTVDKDNSIDIEDYKYGQVLPEIKSLRKITKNLTAEYNEKEKFWFEFGSSILGPVLTLFTEYCINKAVEKNVKIIKPFMREAVILQTLLKRATQYRKYDCDIKSLYISRSSMLLPAIGEMTIGELDTIFDIRNIKFKDVVNIIGLDLDDLQDFNKYFNMYSKEIKKDELKVITEYIIKNYSKKINEFIKEKTKLLVRYLEQENMKSDKIITVDLGVRGTVQENIEKILNKEDIETNMIHLVTISSEQLYTKLQKGINIQTFAGIYEENIDLVNVILDKLIIIEDLMMDERGSTIGYEEKDDSIKPILDENRIPKVEFLYKEVCREGILKFQKMYYECLQSKKCMRDLYKKKREILSILARFATVPSYEESLNLGNLSHENSFGSTATEKICKESDFEILDNLNNEEFLIKAKCMKVVWPEAIVTLRNSTYIQKKVIRSSYNMPRYYREVLDVVEKIKNDNVKQIIIWGAGDVGRVCLDILENEDIEVVAMIDRKEWLWDTVINSVPIQSANFVANKYKDIDKNVLIASFSFVDEIIDSVNQSLENSNIYTLI